MKFLEGSCTKKCLIVITITEQCSAIKKQVEINEIMAHGNVRIFGSTEILEKGSQPSWSNPALFRC
jgi:hypothetical protein